MPETDKEKILRLKALRNNIFDNIQAVFDYTVDLMDTSENFSKFKLKCRNVQKWRKDFEKLHTSLIAVLALQENADTFLPAEEEICNTFLNNCETIEAMYSSIFEQNDDLDQSNTNQFNVKLPKLDLIIFDSDIKNFPTYRNVQCPYTQKTQFQILRSLIT
ncbi:hypothetical protein HHI36_007835 [Cryptolaemus montrouzieri]|uniref:Uncharacterized protein n=1 Tax=Cryptolaemus montrouzieri TaxID=559131 RepID=A0ABD2MQX3_9CUCU